MMRRCLVIALMLVSLASVANDSQVIEIDVKGMTCSFCVDALDRKLNRLSGVKKAQVSLKQKKVRIEMDAGVPVDIEKVKSSIVDAGFTPGQVRQ